MKLNWFNWFKQTFRPRDLLSYNYDALKPYRTSHIYCRLEYYQNAKWAMIIKRSRTTSRSMSVFSHKMISSIFAGHVDFELRISFLCIFIHFPEPWRKWNARNRWFWMKLLCRNQIYCSGLKQVAIEKIPQFERIKSNPQTSTPNQ